MSPASKLKSKPKENSKAAKEQQRSPLAKHSGPTSTGNGSPGSAYNPVSGTFHSFDTARMTSSLPPQGNNVRFRNADETDEHSNSSLGTAAEYDSLSNTGSCSGESEDHKEKVATTTSRQEAIPGSDNEKRENIRQKNERKHQRQRERRAQELHERCSGYLMSRKLEALSQQIVAMGFSSERATLALMVNEGRVEESVNWLFEGNEEEAQKKDVKKLSNLKVDISEELGQIAKLELKYKCSKQEVERAVVACEGDLVKAEENLKVVKPEPAVSPTKPEEPSNLIQPVRPQDKPIAAVATQSSRNEREMNYLKGGTAESALSESGGRNFVPPRTNQLESSVERRWLNNLASSSSLQYSTVSPIQAAPSSAKMMAQLSIGGAEGRNVSQGGVTEPVMMMQRPQAAMNVKQNFASNMAASTPGTAEWFANNAVGVQGMQLHGKPLLHKSSTGSITTGSYSSNNFYPQAQSNRSLGPDNSSTRQCYPQAQYTQQMCTTSSGSVDPTGAAARMGSSWSAMGASSPPRTVPSSLGLFSGWGSSGTSSSSLHMDWNARDMMSNCDYNSIDWTLEANSKPSGLSLGLHSARVPSTNGGIPFAGMKNRGMSIEVALSSVGGGPREWTSPFAGKDIF